MTYPWGNDANRGFDELEGVFKSAMYVWDTGSLAWIKYTPAAGGGGGGDASAANQTTEIAKLTSIDGKLGSLGQKSMAGSAPVVFASDQPALPLSTGAASSANQATEIASLASLDAKTPASPATTAKQDTGNVSLSSIDSKIPASPATAGGQTTGNASLSSIDGKIPASPATTGAQATGNASLSSIDGKITAANTNAVGVTSTVLATNAAQDDTLRSTREQIMLAAYASQMAALDPSKGFELK